MPLGTTTTIPEEYRHSALLRRLYANSLVETGVDDGEHFSPGGRYLNQTKVVAQYGPSAMAEIDRLMLQAESSQQFEFELSDHTAVTMGEMRTLEEESGGDDDPLSSSRPGDSTPSMLHEWLPDPTPITAPLIKLLSATVGEETRARQRARTQAYIDRRLYSNPYLRAATGRFLEITRDLGDFMEFRLYGPDPFVQPARDADPRRDIRAVYREQQRHAYRQANDSAESARMERYLDQTEDREHAYVMHMQDVIENPYYAGAYKVLFQLGAVETSIPPADSGAGPTSSAVSDADMNAEAWEAMRAHVNDPYFHMGRLMAGSRQILASYGEVFKEVWWDPDSFSFHFPSINQITEIYLRAHLPAYTDDMHSALDGFIRAASMQGEEVIAAELRRSYRVPSSPRDSKGEQEPSFYEVTIEEDEEDVELQLDPEGARPLTEELLSPLAQRYSWVVQAEIAARTIVTRLLAPEHIDAVLDEASTSSPLHAKYAEHMRERVAMLEEVSPHQADPLKRQSMRRIFDQFRRDVINREERLREAGFRGIHLADPVDPEDGSGESDGGESRPVEERELWTRDGAGGNTTRIDQRDGNWDYYGNGVEFYEGQAIQFRDGKRGRFLGTLRSVGDRSPAFRAVARSRVLGNRQTLAPRAAIIGTVIGVVQQVVQFIMSNWEWIASIFMMVIASPPGRVFWESWLFFGWTRLVRPLYSGGLASVFGSFTAIANLLADFLILNNAILLFLVTELYRYMLCWIWPFMLIIGIALPFYMVLMIVTGGMSFPFMMIAIVISIFIVFFLPICPPNQKIVDGRMRQTIFSYTDDIIKCFGDESVGSVNIGKGAYNGVCSTKKDCPGWAPCRCPNKGGQLISVFVTFEDNTPCGTEQAPTGECLCWPKLPCEFMFFRIGLQRSFDVDCAADYGYATTDITWYQTDDYFLIAYNAYQNFWIAITYLIRIITQLPRVNPIFFMLVVGFAFLIIFYADMYLGGLILGALALLEYGVPIWRGIVTDLLLPAARTIEDGAIWPLSAIAIWLAGFVRFPNYDDEDPLGSSRRGEGTCFIFNLPTTIGGAGFTFWFWATVVAILWYGFGPIFWLSYHHIAAPFRSGWAIVWYLLQRARRQKHIETVEAAVRQKLPQWLRRGARRTKNAGDALWQYTSPIRGALAPREPEHPLRGWIDSTVPVLEHRHVFGVDEPAPDPPPTTIDGRMRGWGAGTLEGEIYPTTLLGAGEGQRRPLRPRAALRRGTVPPHLRKRMAKRRARRTSGETPREEAWSESEKNV